VPGEGVGACSDISSLVGWRMLVLIRVWDVDMLLCTEEVKKDEKVT
jgi:hypothetical protein